MKVVDADAHVEENEAMWTHLDAEFRGRRPIPLTFPEGELSGPYSNSNAVWMIEGKIFPKQQGRGYHTFATPPLSARARAKPYSIGAQDMTDVPARLADMDQHGITCQVVYPTLFLVTLAEELGLERALCQAYNRFMSEACAKSQGRIYFAAVVPTQYAPDAIQVAREAKELGAVSVMVPGLLWDKPLSDESFLPFYEELAKLNLPLGVHVAWGSPSLTNIFSKPEDGAFGSFILPVVMGFWSLMVTGVYDRFPELKVAFLEAGCESLPYAINQLDRSYHQGRYKLRHAPSEYLRLGNIYLACEAEEDLEYVLRYIQDDQLSIASLQWKRTSSRRSRSIRPSCRPRRGRKSCPQIRSGCTT